ncbi:MAG: rubrerythrin family protein [Deltaproteobacteria bacterium]|nr:rubrerythrin family protein [Deltaproteobacteria bacterium]
MGATKDALEQAYAGEAKAALRLKVYAEKADEEGYPQIAKLFRVIARSEEIHGARALRVLKEIKSTEKNLEESFQSEVGVAQVAYAAFVREAEAEGNQGAVLHFSQSRDVEEGHGKLYKEAMNHLMEGRETSYYVCRICGYVADGVLPETCPVCGAPAAEFDAFE